MAINKSSTLRENSVNELNIFLEINGKIYTRTSISEFTYSNEMNTQPFGQFNLKDTGELDQTGLQSGSFATLYFSNTSDNNTTVKRMALAIFLTHVELMEKVDVFVSYKILFKAGSMDQLMVRTGDVVAQSTSIDALNTIIKNRNSTVVGAYTGIKPNDSMNWLVVNQNMWDQLASVVNKSFLANDYIFWAWDESNNTFKISSIKSEYLFTDSHIFTRTMDDLGTTSNAFIFNEKVGLNIWKFNNHKKSNTLGSSYKYLFPNVSFSGIPSNRIKLGELRSKNFITVLKSIGDNKLDDVLSYTRIPSDAVFGDLQIRKHTLNGHEYYAIADIYRDYKIATYAKTFILQIYNSVGPAVGTCVYVYNQNSDTGGTVDPDKQFSDKYIIKKKIIQYDGFIINGVNRKTGSVTNYVTTLMLVSDNYVEGIKPIEDIFNKLK